MRERHFPRVCRSCRAPMARQEDACWRCGIHWASQDGPRTTPQVLARGAQVGGGPDPPIAVAARAASDARLDADRWASDGGSFVSEVPVRARAVS